MGGPLKGAVDVPVDSALYHWQGATVRNLVNFGRASALLGSRELADNRGILIKAVAPDSVAARAKRPADAAIRRVPDNSPLPYGRERPASPAAI